MSPAPLVDLHCHGALGHEFGADADGSRTAAGHLAASGVAHVVASLVSASAVRMRHHAVTLAGLVADGTLAGIHLEGPFLSPARRGAHDPAALRDPDPGWVEEVVTAVGEAGAAYGIRQVTFAPELPGADRLVNALVRHRIIPAIGHTNADARTVARAIDAIVTARGGPALVTHLFNGMPTFHHRDGGPVAAALAAAARGDVVVELIADGVHLAPEVVRMVFDLIGPERIALVSDATPATGLGDGDHLLGGRSVRVTAGVARIAEADAVIAGSTATLADCVTWAIERAGVARGDALVAASRTPARVLGLDVDRGGRPPV